MKGLIIATHGKLSEGLQDAVGVITGMGDRVETLGLFQADNLDHFEQDFLDRVSKFREEGSIVLVDMLGGSPYNIAMKHVKENYNYEIVTGVNLMMVIEVLTNLDAMSVSELSNLAQRVGKDSVNKYPQSEEDDEVEYYEEDDEGYSYDTGGNITFARVDHRLLHGQVVTKWSKIASANTIIIVDDDLFKDEFMADVYRSAAPAGVEVIIVPSEVIAYAQENDTLPSGNVMLLFKDIVGVKRAYDEGLRLDELQLGGVPNDGTRKMVFTAVSLSEKDVELLNEVKDFGTKIDLQVVPEERGITYEEALRKMGNN